MQKLRLFVVESLSPLDMLEGRTEGVALEKICKIMGHDVALLDAHSSNDLYKYCDYISSIDRHSLIKHPLCIHLAAHGNCVWVNEKGKLIPIAFEFTAKNRLTNG
ncbi:hypothetical protein AB7D55_004110 [Vibrio mimicus]